MSRDCLLDCLNSPLKELAIIALFMIAYVTDSCDSWLDNHDIATLAALNSRLVSRRRWRWVHFGPGVALAIDRGLIRWAEAFVAVCGMIDLRRFEKLVTRMNAWGLPNGL
jgi:hypothetical protein